MSGLWFGSICAPRVGDYSALSWSKGTEQNCASFSGYWPTPGLRVNDVTFTQGCIQHNGEEKCGCSVFKCCLTAFSGLVTASVYNVTEAPLFL